MRRRKRNIICRPAAVFGSDQLRLILICAAVVLLSPGIGLAQTTTGTALAAEISPAQALAHETRQSEKENSGTSILAAPQSSSSPGQTPLAYGPLQAHFSVNYRILSGNDILRRPGERRETILQEVTPSMSLLLGSHWIVSYSPGLKYYSDERFADTLSHHVSLQGEVRLGDWSVGLAQRFAVSSDSLIETGSQTERKNFATELSASRSLGLRTSIDLSIEQDILDAPGFSSSRRWSTTEWLNYRAFNAVSTGVGVGFGYSDVDIGSDMLHEQIQGRIRWTPSMHKVFAEVSAGGELRQFIESNSSSLFSPIFSGSIGYVPTDATSLSLGMSRSVQPSLLGNRVSESTSFRFGFRQRFLGKLYLDVNPGYRVTDYSSTLGSTGIKRSGSNYFVSTRLSMALLRRGRVSLFHQINVNDSSSSGFGFESHQMGLELGYRY